MTKKCAVAARTAAVKRRTFTREFKLKVIREVEAGKSQAQVAREYQITENTISKWRRQRAFVRTTNSRHNLMVYRNLTGNLALSTSINSGWPTSLTFACLREFIYLAVLLDAFSRRCIGWAISRHIDTQLTLAALQMALHTRTIQSGLIHHSVRLPSLVAVFHLLPAGTRRMLGGS